MKDFTLVPTEDGSLTLYTPEYQENTHTIHGAYEEAMFKHVLPSGILNIEQKELVVLDVGFGLGYNILALLSQWDTNNDQSLEIYSFEKETSIGPFLNQLNFQDNRKRFVPLLQQAFNRGQATMDNIKIQLLFGDARQSIGQLSHLTGQVSAVFHDPHSPGKNCELWTVEFFQILYSLMEPKGMLTTYSFAPHVRRAMVEAGFHMAPFISEKFQKEGTLASKSLIANAIEGEELVQLKESIKHYPFHDNRQLNLSREEIRQTRINEKQRLRDELND